MIIKKMDNSKAKILVIDDEPFNARILQDIFKQEKWQTDWALDGQSGIDQAISSLPHVILLDVVLPDMNGFEVCRILKAHNTTRDIPVLFLTAKTGKEDKLRAFEAGAVDFITKPFFVEEVRARVKTQIKLKLFSDELKEKNQQLAILAEKLQMLSLTDGLMLIWNRRAFEIEIDRVHQNSVRYRHPYCLLIADLDFFKGLNDYYGHQAGDRILHQMGRIFKQAVRSTDFVARYGGEEIVVILPETDCSGGIETARRIQQLVADEKIVHPYNPVHKYLTVSIGIAAFDPETPDLSYYEVIRQADKALYQAKDAGRNTIRTYRE
ncbi:MAG: diguanylate cyclase [Syntrophothermaceae bacterium]|jgi:diguanylate cyclase (GGDEF)-like protein